MRAASVLVECLFRRQNQDGGWSYSPGLRSSCEPTGLALLALESANARTAPYSRGCEWLRERQRTDGGWAPNDAAHISASVTSIAILALSESADTQSFRLSLGWLLGQVKPELSWQGRVEYWLQHMPAGEATMGGSPWLPGTAAWIAPTVLAALAFADANRRSQDPSLVSAVRRARTYVLSRQCSDGGWNNGGTRFRSPNAASYPEMTGMALLALDGITSPPVARALSLAGSMASAPGSGEADSWLRLALVKHKRSLPATDNLLPFRTTRDLALQLLAATASSPSNKFQQPTVWNV